MNTKAAAKRIVHFLFAVISLFLVAVSVYYLFSASDLLVNKEPEYVVPKPVAVSSSDKLVTWHGCQTGTVSERKVLMHSEPDTTAPTTYAPGIGEKVIAFERIGDWYNIRIGMHSGWVRGSEILLNDDYTEIPYSPSEDNIDEIPSECAEKLDEIAARYRCTGTSVAIIKDGEVSLVHTYGWADLKNKVKMKPDNKLRVASLSKVAIAMSAMSMTDIGWVSLDEDISTYIGRKVRNPYYGSTPVTLRAMLTHTSSLQEITEYSSALSLLANSKSYRRGKPGSPEMWSYSNIASGCAGAVLECASDMTLVDFTDKYYFASLGIDASYYPKNLADTSLIANLYSGSNLVRDVKTQLNRFYTETPGGNSKLYYGGLVISAKDYARLMCILINDGSYHGVAYMTPGAAEEMKTPQISRPDFDQCIILRKHSDFYDGRTLYYHTGNATGVLALASFDDETGDGVVVLTNGATGQRDDYGVYAVCGEMTECCYQMLLSD